MNCSVKADGHVKDDEHFEILLADTRNPSDYQIEERISSICAEKLTGISKVELSCPLKTNNAFENRDESGLLELLCNTLLDESAWKWASNNFARGVRSRATKKELGIIIGAELAMLLNPFPDARDCWLKNCSLATQMLVSSNHTERAWTCATTLNCALFFRITLIACPILFVIPNFS